MTIESGKDGQTGLMIQCISCKWWSGPEIEGTDRRVCGNPSLRAEGADILFGGRHYPIITSPIFACNQSEAK